MTSESWHHSRKQHTVSGADASSTVPSTQAVDPVGTGCGADSSVEHGMPVQCRVADSCVAISQLLYVCQQHQMIWVQAR